MTPDRARDAATVRAVVAEDLADLILERHGAADFRGWLDDLAAANAELAEDVARDGGWRA